MPQNHISHQYSRLFRQEDFADGFFADLSHGIMVDYDIFENVKKADLANFSKIYTTEELDFRLKQNAVAVDAGCILSNVNDSFTGKAPDLGALEVGRPVPIYGPRP